MDCMLEAIGLHVEKRKFWIFFVSLLFCVPGPYTNESKNKNEVSLIYKTKFKHIFVLHPYLAVPVISEDLNISERANKSGRVNIECFL